MQKHRDEGFKILDARGPAFLALRVEDGKIVSATAVFVAAPGSRLSYEQAVWKAACEKYSMPTKVEVIP